MGREAGIEHQFPGRSAVALLPELDEAQDLVVLVPLADPGIGVDEQAGVGVSGSGLYHPHKGHCRTVLEMSGFLSVIRCRETVEHAIGTLQ